MILFYLDNKFKTIKEESEKYQALWEEADKVYEPFDWGEDISYFPTSDANENSDDIINN